MLIKLNQFNLIQVDEHGAIGKKKRRTSIIYLDVTEATKGKINKTKKKKGKKKKRQKKKNKNRRKNIKESGSIINKLHEESSGSNGTLRRKATSLLSPDWKEFVPESNMSDSKLSGENNMNRKPVDIIVHIKVKEQFDLFLF